ncbi:MAG: glutaredoxin family protein [Bacillales bacterium]
MPVVKLYTRKRCPLCDDAKKILLELREERGFSLEEVDIEESDALTELYGLMIPVVEINGVEVQYGKINKNVIKNYLNKVIVD